MTALLLMTGVMAVLSVSAAPDAGGRVPYEYSVDDLNGEHISGTMIGVIKDLHLPEGESLTVKGWLATGEGVAAYQYLWLPAGGGQAEWKTVDAKNAAIFKRGDLASAGVPYPSGHSTAGFDLTIDPPEGTPEGVYDVYIRALDGMGTPCDLVALLRLRYGDPDIDDGRSRLISFSRILREGGNAVAGDTVVSEDGIVLSENARVRLGELDLAVFEQLRITYKASDTGVAVGEGRRAVLGLKSSGDHGYGKTGEPYNMTDSLVYAALDPAVEEGVLEIDLTPCGENGEVWLTGYLGGELTVTSVEFIYNGCATDRVAARIDLSGDLINTYFSSNNRTEATGVTDPVLGEVLRLEVREDTNDPYIHFNAGQLLADNEIALDADEYKYMVLLCRALPENSHNTMTFYLCAGPITSATEACTRSFSVQNDGKWHYYLIDLTRTENWSGIINGWRFDYLNGDSLAGHAVEFASVQFFRTLEGAEQAANEDPLAREPYKSGDPAVVRDMSEENTGSESDYVIDPEDTYIVTEPVTEPPTESMTLSTTPSPAESDARPDDTSAEGEPSDPRETEPAAKQGCASTLSMLPLMLLPVAVLPALRRRKDE